jgi:hypothetical protein
VPPAEQGIEADKIISILWGYEPEPSTALLPKSEQQSKMQLSEGQFHEETRVEK